MGQPGDSEENFCDSEVEVVFKLSRHIVLVLNWLMNLSYQLSRVVSD